MNKTPRESRAFFEEWQRVGGEAGWNFGDIGLAFFPPTTSLEAVSQIRNVKHNFEFGAQNCWFEKSGAFTGETSAETVRDMGGQFVLIGHSERRSLFHETNELLAKKLALVQSLGMTPMFCIGESLQEREASQTNSVLQKQIQEGLKFAKPERPLVVAYEPVWAIGTGKVATPEQVKETHAFVRQELDRTGFKGVSLLYGGSVKGDNAHALFKIENVNGFLVGGASLEPKSFRQIVEGVLQK